MLTFTLFACKQQNNNAQDLQHRMDSLEIKLANTYKPGIGEFMSGIQAHHSKLWFAGQNKNWQLADFEIHEIMEFVDNIKKYQSSSNESQLIGIIDPAIDSIKNAIKLENPILFKSSFYRLINACNSCHRSTNFEFNKIKVPEISPYTNQDFKGDY